MKRRFAFMLLLACQRDAWRGELVVCDGASTAYKSLQIDGAERVLLIADAAGLERLELRRVGDHYDVDRNRQNISNIVLDEQPQNSRVHITWDEGATHAKTDTLSCRATRRISWWDTVSFGAEFHEPATAPTR